VLLKVAGLARSTYYYQMQVATAPDRHSALKERIKAVYKKHKGRYGYRRVHMTLSNEGIHVNHKTVFRLMQNLGLKSQIRRQRYKSYMGNVGRVAHDLLKRRFQAKRPNQKWVTDVTEFNIEGSKLYLSPILDLYNGEIVSYQIAKSPKFELVDNMLTKAMKRLNKEDKPILHSDQGWQYQMAAYQMRLKQRGMRISMSRKGNCLDNAAMESFFGTLKSECFYTNKFSTVSELEKTLHEYIRYYNHDRIKLKLNGLSPVQYRTQAGKT